MTGDHPYHGLPDVPKLYLQGSEKTPKSDTSQVSWENKAIDNLVQDLRNLREDHVSGAKDLATKALSTLVNVSQIAADDIVSHEKSISSDQWWDISRKAGWYICKYGRPSMGAAINAVITKSLDRTNLGLPGERDVKEAEKEKKLIQNGIKCLHESLTRRKSDEQGNQMRMHFHELIQHVLSSQKEIKTNSLNILTLSSSSTVKNAILSAMAGEYLISSMPIYIALHIRIMESRPLCEGASMASELVKEAKEKGYYDRLHIELASDSSVAMLAKDADLVIIGADRIADTGDVSNKIGSFPAALCAKTVTHGRCRVAVVAELEKVAKPGAREDKSIENNDITELTNGWNDELKELASTKNVKCRNVYFEWVPVQYIDYYVCEKGILGSKDIKKQSLLAEKIEKNVFKGLENL